MKSLGLIVVFLFSVVASADRQVSANSALGFGTSDDKNKEATLDRQQANKVVGNDQQAMSDKAATPKTPGDQVSGAKPSTASDAAFQKMVKNDLVDLSTRIGKIRNEILADSQIKKYDGRAGLARLDERWQKLEEIVSQWSATEGKALKPEQRQDVSQRLNNLKLDLAKQEALIKK